MGQGPRRSRTDNEHLGDQYLFGPRFTMRADRVSIFAHALVGSASGDSGIGGFSESGFTLGSGGGVDIGISQRLAARVQFDWLGSFQDMIEDNTRLGIGMVVRLGGGLESGTNFLQPVTRMPRFQLGHCGASLSRQNDPERSGGHHNWQELQRD